MRGLVDEDGHWAGLELNCAVKYDEKSTGLQKCFEGEDLVFSFIKEDLFAELHCFPVDDQNARLNQVVKDK